MKNKIKKTGIFSRSKHNSLFSILQKMDFDILLSGIFIFDIVILTWDFYILEINLELDLNLTAIYAIVGAFLGSLFIFIMAEGLRDKEHPYKIKIFFKSSKLITIIILFLFFLILLLFQENNYILTTSFIALLGFVCLSIYAISQIALITLDIEELWERHVDLFKDRIKKVTEIFYRIRLNTKEFHEFIIQSNNRIKWLKPKPSSHTSLKSLRKGTIVDIKVEELKAVVNENREA